MKLYQALKEKNKLVGDLNKLWKKVSSNNSVMVGNTPDYDVKELLQQINTKTDALVSLKTSINTANHPIQKDIFELAELKSKLAKYTAIDTRNGKHSISYREDVMAEFVATITVQNVDAMIVHFTDKIDRLQEILDNYNHKTDI